MVTWPVIVCLRPITQNIEGLGETTLRSPSPSAAAELRNGRPSVSAAEAKSGALIQAVPRTNETRQLVFVVVITSLAFGQPTAVTTTVAALPSATTVKTAGIAKPAARPSRAVTKSGTARRLLSCIKAGAISRAIWHAVRPRPSPPTGGNRPYPALETAATVAKSA